MSPEERSAFDYYWNISKRSAINTLRAAKEEGEVSGALKANLATAIKLVKRGLAIKDAAEDTGLSIAEIETEIEKSKSNQ